MLVLVVGGGRIGSYLAEELDSKQHEGVVIEKKPERCEQLARLFEGTKIRVVNGDGNDPSVLREAGARDADALATATGEDEDNLVVGLLGKREFGIRRVVGRLGGDPKRVRSLLTADFKQPARRPLKSGLITDKAQAALKKHKLWDLDTALDYTVSQMSGPKQ